MKRSITVMYDNHPYTLTWLRGLIWAKREFREAGYEIVIEGPSAYIKGSYQRSPIFDDEYYEKYVDGKKYDIVFLAHHESHDKSLAAQSPRKRKAALEAIKRHCNELVWLDTSDSTGTCFFDVLPFVDKYLKKQILCDEERYTKPIWGGRIFCEYYHEKYGVDDPRLSNCNYPVLDMQYKDKIGLSWNVGLGDLFARSKFEKLFYRNRFTPVTFTKPNINRKYDVHYRGTKAKDDVVGYQRGMAMDLICARHDLSIPDVTTKVPYSEYVEEVKDSRTIVSPFGWGEICTRDFEAFLHGAAMIKMDMSHMYTYPDAYIKDKTYISVDWDFNNFNDVISYILTDEGKEYALYIANNGQNFYKDYLTSKDKKVEFVKHLLHEIGI